MNVYGKMTTVSLLIFLLLILNNYNVTGSICESECLCKDATGDDFHGDAIDCSYEPNILKSDYDLTQTVYSLDLSMNNISEVQKSKLLRSNNMRELYLNENYITKINPVFELPNLKLLDLSDNDLDFIHADTFKTMTKLEYLNLSNNNIAVFDLLPYYPLVNLKEIVLSNNDIGQSLRTGIFGDTDSEGGLTHKIESLIMRNVNMQRVPENFFSYAYNLRKLDISANNLSEIFEIPYTLEYLDLSDNPISVLYMEDFSDLPALKYLKLNNLQITEIPDFVFSPLVGLLNLELERNRLLTSFSALAFGEDVLDDADEFALKRLTVKGSMLTTLDERLKEPFSQLSGLDLQINPWDCDCNLVWIKQLQIEPSDYKQLRCATPERLRNTQIFTLEDKKFICALHRRVFAFSMVVIGSCIMLTMAVLWIYVFIPKYNKHGRFAQSWNAPTAAYSMLPLSMNTSNPYDYR